MVVVHRQADLLEVGGTLRSPRRLASGLHGGQQECDQHRDDGDHDEELDQGESSLHLNLFLSLQGEPDSPTSPARARQGPRVPDQLVDERPDAGGQLRIAQGARLVERLIDPGDGERDRDRDTPHGQADQSQLGEAIEAAEPARRHRDDADRLAPQDARREVVERILEGTRVAVLVLRRDDHEAVGATQLLAQPDGTGWGIVGLAEAVSHDGEVEVRQVDQRGGDIVAALEPAQEQPGDMGTPPARPDGTEEHRDGEPRIVRHRSRPPGIRS